MYQYNNHNQRRSGLRLDVRRRKKKQRKNIVLIALISAILLAVFAMLSAYGIINVRSLFGKDGDFKPPVYTDSDTEKIPDTSVMTDTDSETVDTTDTENETQTTETPPPVTTPPETTPQVTEPITSDPETTETLPPDTEGDDTSTGDDSSSDSSYDSSPDSSDDSSPDSSDDSFPDSSDDSSPDSSDDSSTDGSDDSSPDSTGDSSPDSSDNSSTDSSDDSSSDDPSSDSGSSDEELLNPPENRFEWPCVLSETEPAGDDYFADTLFIGDSRMQGVEFACGKESAATFYTAVSVTAAQISTREGVKIMVDGTVKTVTILDAIKQSGRQFKRIYMMFGINELGAYGGTRTIIRGYRAAVETIREIQPEAEICIIGVMPVFNSRNSVSGYKGYEANPRILDLNISLIEMANEMKLHYLDTYHLFVASDGQLRSEVSNDGLHLSGAYSKELMEYVKTHAITE